MGRPQQQAQAVAQRTQAITNQDSFQLVKCLIRVSVYHVCWMRGLFPEASFSGHDLAQLDQLHVKMLEPNTQDDEANTLKQWVEQGVMDSVSKGYLKNMYFGISQDAAGTNLLEEYIYTFKYGKDGVEFDMEAAVSGKNKKKYKSTKTERPGVDDVRYQVVRLMRMLVQLCQTLDKVPDERYIFIKLTYHDHTPDAYEPPYFHGVAEEGIGHFHRRPFSMDVGSMDTQHHTVSVRVKSVLDSCDDEEGPDDGAMQEMKGSQQMPAEQQCVCDDEDMAEAAGGEDPPSLEEPEVATVLAVGAAELSPDNRHARTEEALDLLTATEDPNALLMDTDGSLPQGQEAAAPEGPQDSQDDTRCSDEHMEENEEGGGGSAGGSFGCSGQAAYESVRSFCLARPAVAFVDLLANFYKLSEEQLGKVLDGLCMEGLLQAGPEDTYTVLHAATTATAGGPNAPTTSEGHMAEAPGAGSGGSVAVTAAHRRTGQDHSMAEDQMLMQMSGLTVGAAAAAAAGAAKARGGKANASVYAAAMHAGSLMTGQPGAPAGAPTAATPQMDPAAAGDEPSVQLQQDQQQALWFDASQHSFQGPAHTGAAAAAEAAARVGGGSTGVAAAGRGGGSKLRKASYVNSPIYQHPGKRGPGSKLYEQQQQEEQEEQQQRKREAAEAAAAEAEGEGEDSFGQQQQQPKQEQQRKAAGAMAPPRKKVTVRKPKKGANPAATPTRSGRLAGMSAKR